MTLTNDAIAARYLAKRLPVERIAEQAGLTTAGLYRRLQAMGVSGERATSWGGVLTREYLEQALEDGVPLRVLARQVGCSTASVYEWLRKHGLYASSDARDLARVRKMYERGASIQQVASRLNVHRRTATRMLHEAGVEMRPAGRRDGKQRRRA